MERHEVPTHLDVEDTLFWGLTLPRLFGVIATLGAAYGLSARFPWQLLGLQTSTLRWALPMVLAVMGLALALVRPGGRPLAAWGLDVARFALRPRQRRGPAFPDDDSSRESD